MANELERQNIFFEIETSVKNSGDVDKAIGKFGALRDVFNELGEGIREGVNEAIEEKNQKLKESEKATEKAEKSNKKLTKSQEQLNKEYEAAKKQLKEQIRQLSFFGTSLGQVSDVGKQATTTIRAFVRRLGTVKAAIAATGIGALALALASVAQFATKAQSGMDKLSQATAAASGAAGVIFDRLASVGGAIFGAVSGTNDWSDVLNTVKDSTKDLGADIKAAADEGIRIEKLFQQIAKDSIALRKETALTRAEIKELNKISEDTSATYADRIEAVKEAGRLEENLIAKRLGLANRELAAQNELNELNRINGEISNADLEKEAELVEKVGALRLESSELLTVIQNKSNVLLREQETRLLAIANAQRAINEQTQDLLNNLIADDVTRDIEQINIDAQRAIEAVRRNQKTFLESLIGTPEEQAKEASIYSKVVDEQIGLIGENAKQKVAEVIESIDDPFRGLFANDFVQPLEKLGEVGKDLELGLSNAVDPQLGGKNAIDKSQEFIDTLISSFETFRDDPIISEAYDSINAAAQTFFDAEVERNEALISLQEERVSRALAVAGEGNSEALQLEEERLRQLQEKRDRAARAQQRIERIQIAGAQAVAVAKSIQAVASAFASGNIVNGIITSVALAANVAAAISSTRNAFSSIPSFYDGTENTTRGNVDSRGGFQAILHPNERVLPAKLNKPLLDAKISNVDLPQLALDGLKYRQGKLNIDAIRKPGASSHSPIDFKKVIKGIQGTNERLDALGFHASLDINGFNAGMKKRARKEKKRRMLG